MMRKSICRWMILGAVALFVAAPFAGAAPSKKAPAPTAATVDPILLKKTSDGQALFLDVLQRIKGDIPVNASIMLSIQGLDLIDHAALVRELVNFGRAGVVERDDFGSELILHEENSTLIPGRGPTPAPVPTPTEVHAFPLSTHNMQIVAPNTPIRWAVPDLLAKLTVFNGVDAQAASRYLVTGDQVPAHFSCMGLRIIDAKTGLIRSEAIKCGSSEEDGLAEIRDALISDSGGENALCGRSERILQLPIENTGKPTQPGMVHEARYLSINEALASAGCQVMDIPPGAQSSKEGQWRYHESSIEPVSATQIKGWIQARYAVQVVASVERRTAAQLLTNMDGIDPQLIDPDILLAEKTASAPVLNISVKAVDLSTGRIVSESSILTGVGMPGDVLATVIGDLILTRAPTAWLEVHPFPQSAKVRIDNIPVSLVNNVGLVRLSPGTHSADVFLAGGSGKSDANASFKLRAPEYGILAIAAPNGSLMVRTIPVGADVSVDGESWGKSEVVKTTGLGDHKVTAYIDGCGGAEGTANVKIGEDNMIILPLPGTISASAEPETATILIDGKVEGVGSIKPTTVAYGEHRVTFRLNGYEDHIVIVDVDACKEHPIKYRFDGTISVSSVPERSQVRVDGETVGAAPLSYIVRPGSRKVECYWCEFGYAEAETEVVPGQTVSIPISLNGKGFRIGFGPDIGFLGRPAGGNGFSPTIGLNTDFWFGGRGGFVTSEGVLTDKGFYFSGGPAIRALAPVASTTMPLSLQFVYVSNPNSETFLGGLGNIGLHICSGHNLVYLFDIGFGYGSAGKNNGVIGVFDFGIQWRSGAFWQPKRDPDL